MHLPRPHSNPLRAITRAEDAALIAVCSLAVLTLLTLVGTGLFSALGSL